MVYKLIRRAEISIKSDAEISHILDEVAMGKKTDIEAMNDLGILNHADFKKLYTLKRKQLHTLDGIYRGTISRDAGKTMLSMTENELDKRLDWYKNQYLSKSAYPKTYKRASKPEYDLNVQKMVSYKGTIRPMTLDVKNQYGGSYKLRVLNIYVKPNFIKKVKDRKTGTEKEILRENVRFYEEDVYPVDKKAIAKGSASENYYPDKASWSSPSPKVKKEKSTQSGTSKSEDIIQLRKRLKRHLHIKRLKKDKKPIIRCKCKTTKKR